MSTLSILYHILFAGKAASVAVAPSTKLCKAIDVIRRILEKSCCKLYDGSVYKKISEAKYTYVFCSSVEDYILHSLGKLFYRLRR